VKTATQQPKGTGPRQQTDSTISPTTTGGQTHQGVKHGNRGATGSGKGRMASHVPKRQRGMAEAITQRGQADLQRPGYLDSDQVTGAKTRPETQKKAAQISFSGRAVGVC